MIKFVAFVKTLDQFEVLLQAAKDMEVETEVGVHVPRVVVEPRPRKVPLKSKVTKPVTKKRARGLPGDKLVVGPIPEGSTLKEREIHDTLKRNFGVNGFTRTQAKDVIIKAGVANHPSSYLSHLRQSGGLVLAVQS